MPGNKKADMMSAATCFSRVTGLAALLFVLLLLSACEPGDDVSLTVVTDTTRLNDEQLAALQHHHDAASLEHAYAFGFDQRRSVEEDVAQYLPFLDYLQRATGYTFKIAFTPKYSLTADELGNNRVQFAAIGAAGYVYAQRRYGAISLVHGVNAQGKAEYRACFVVRPGSNIKTLQDIRGKKLAFGNRDSTQGHLIPRIMLAKQGNTLQDLKAYSYTGSHQKCAEAVVAGAADVCGTQDQLAQELAEQGLISILACSAYYPSSGIAASPDVPESVREAVKQALLAFEPEGKDSNGLYQWEKTEMSKGFIESSPEDYRELERWLLKLGFIRDDIKQDAAG